MKKIMLLLLSYSLIIMFFYGINVTNVTAYVKYYNYSKNKLIKPYAEINDLTRLRFPKNENEEYYVNYYSTRNGYDFESKYSPFSLIKPSFQDKNYNIINYRMGVPMNKSGARRYIEYRVKPSADLADAINSFDIEPIGIKESKPGNDNERRYNNNGLNPSPYHYSLNGKDFKTKDSDGINTYVSSSYLGDSNGGNANIIVKLKDIFIKKSSKIYTHMISNTLHIYRADGKKNGSDAVYPTFEALRIIDYDDLQGNKHNSFVLGQLKDKAQNKIDQEYTELYNQISKLDNPPYNDYIKEHILAEIQKYRLGSSLDSSFGTYNINDIKDEEANYNDKTSEKINNIVENTITKMKNVLINFKYLRMEVVPNLNFGTHFINNFTSISLNNELISKVTSLNSREYSLYLSISNLKNADGYELNPVYYFDGNLYNYGDNFMYYKTINSPNGSNTIKKNKNDLRLIVPISRIKAGNYEGTATWNIRKGPS